MKKVFLTAAVVFATCAVSAQTSVVKEAKSAKSDPVKAAQILEPALSDPTTANDPNTWKLAGDFQKSIYDDENMKLYLPGGQADTTKLYNSLAKMFEYYMKCDEVEQAKVASGEQDLMHTIQVSMMLLCSSSDFIAMLLLHLYSQIWMRLRTIHLFLLLQTMLHWLPIH